MLKAIGVDVMLKFVDRIQWGKVISPLDFIFRFRHLSLKIWMKFC